ncbi:MAG: D-glycero-alpha-D-manno-heptose-1,7-bisphosphate 7-phosphatase [Planctomycetaceae bacterium]
MNKTGAAKRYVLLDRDGTINVERQYLSHPRQVELLPGAAAGLRAMQAAGLGLIVVTNQSGIARGYFDDERVDAIHRHLEKLLVAEGVTLEAIFYCPHAPDDGCACRKPRPGMVRAAAREYGLDPARAFVIGDKPCDIELGRAVGATTVMVRTGYGAHWAAELAGVALLSVTRPCPHPDHIVDDLREAAEVIERAVSTAAKDPKSNRGAA